MKMKMKMKFKCPPPPQTTSASQSRSLRSSQRSQSQRGRGRSGRTITEKYKDCDACDCEEEFTSDDEIYDSPASAPDLGNFKVFCTEALELYHKKNYALVKVNNDGELSDYQCNKLLKQYWKDMDPDDRNRFIMSVASNASKRQGPWN